MPCSVPRWIEQVLGRFLPHSCGLPRLTGGSASTTSLSRPAQASLALRPARSQPAQGGLLSRGFDLAGYPTEPLGSYHVLPTTTWMDPPSTGDLRRWGARRVEEGRGTDTGLHADPFPFPAHQTGRALFEHPAFRQTSPTAHGRHPKWTSRSRNTPKSPNTTASEKRVAPREATLWRCRRKFRTRS